MPRKFCRKCMRGYETKYESLEASKSAHDKTAQEQFYSGICSDACWYACTPEEIVHFKWVKPYRATKKFVLIVDKTGEVTTIDTRAPR